MTIRAQDLTSSQSGGAGIPGPRDPGSCFNTDRSGFPESDTGSAGFTSRQPGGRSRDEIDSTALAIPALNDRACASEESVNPAHNETPENVPAVLPRPLVCPVCATALLAVAGFIECPPCDLAWPVDELHKPGYRGAWS